MQRVVLPLDRITPRAGNRAAGGFDQAKLAELAESIKDQGILQPLIVTAGAAPGSYELVAGERRWRAAQLAGLTEVPVTILDESAGAADVELAAIIENIQRDDVHPLDESDAYARLRRLGLPVARIVERVGRSRPHVDGRLRLQNLIGAIRDYWIKEGKLHIGTADQIARLPDVHQQRLWKKVQKDTRVLDGNGLHWWIESTTDLLIHAPFDRGDESLTTAPACGACPKRFGFVDFSLFDDGEDHPDARCGDPGCWKAKLRAHVDRTRTALERTRTEYVESGSRKGQIKPYEWSEVDPDAPTDPNDPDYDHRHAPDPNLPVETFLITDGPAAGRAVQGQRNRSSGAFGGYVERDWEAERIERERRHAEHLAARHPLFRLYAGHVGGDVDLVGLLTEDHMLWEIASDLARGLHGPAIQALNLAFGIEYDPDAEWHERTHQLGTKVAELAKADGGASLLRLVLLSCAVRHMDRSRHGDVDDSDGDDFLVDLLDRAGIEHADVPPDAVPDFDDEAEGANEPAA